MDSDPAVPARIDPARTELVHLADGPTTRIDRRLLTQSFRLFPGQGNLPVAEFCSWLRTLGYKGTMPIGIFNDQNRALPAEQIALDGMRSFHLIKEAHRGVEPLFDLLDLALVEFTADARDGADVARLRRAVGFGRTHDSYATSPTH